MKKEPVQDFPCKTRMGESSTNYFFCGRFKIKGFFNFFFNIILNSKTDSHKEVFRGLKSKPVRS